MEVQYNYGQIFNQVINALLKFLFIASKTLMKSWVVNANTAGAAFDWDRVFYCEAFDTRNAISWGIENKWKGFIVGVAVWNLQI